MSKAIIDYLKRENCLREYDKEALTTAGLYVKRYYVFTCRECGNEIHIRHDHLRTHHGYCLACSCRVKARAQRKRPYERLYGLFLHVARHRGIEVTLTYDDFFVLMQDNRCHYCGADVKRSMYGNPKARNGSGQFIDRKDNNRGYAKDNCVTCCWPCNDFKSNKISYDEMVALKSVAQ